MPIRLDDQRRARWDSFSGPRPSVSGIQLAKVPTAVHVSTHQSITPYTSGTFATYPTLGECSTGTGLTSTLVPDPARDWDFGCVRQHHTKSEKDVLDHTDGFSLSLSSQGRTHH